MAKRVINIGQTANDRSGDPLRTAFSKINENFNELYASSGPNTTIETVAQGGISGTETPLSLAVQTHVLKDGWYSLAAGTEGQVMFFVPHSSVTDIQNINIRVNNGRYNNGISVTDYANNFITLFSGVSGTAIVTAIYANSAWNFDKGSWD